MSGEKGELDVPALEEIFIDNKEDMVRVTLLSGRTYEGCYIDSDDVWLHLGYQDEEPEREIITHTIRTSQIECVEYIGADDEKADTAESPTAETA